MRVNVLLFKTANLTKYRPHEPNAGSKQTHLLGEALGFIGNECYVGAEHINRL